MGKYRKRRKKRREDEGMRVKSDKDAIQLPIVQYRGSGPIRDFTSPNGAVSNGINLDM